MPGASGSQMKADLDILSGVSSKMVNDYEQLQSAITTLQGEAETHAASWSGEAKNAWNTAMDGVNTAWTALNSVLDEIAQNISTSGSHYGSTDSSNAQTISQVQTGDITSALVR